MLGELLFRFYRFPRLRRYVVSVIRISERGDFYSPTLRRIFREYWDVEIGMYTHGACFEQWVVDPQTKIGRYCSIAGGVRILNHNHPIAFKSTSALFFNPGLGHVAEQLVPFTQLTIGHDVWIGANAVILPEVNRIGNGAVIGAGAVVSRDVPDFAVVLGNPARVVKYRFSDEMIAQLLEERWWERDIDELARDIKVFQRPLERLGTKAPAGD